MSGTARRHDTGIAVAKGIAIIMMVIWHSGCPVPGYSVTFNTFCMALFFICSGYCFNPSRLSAPKEFYIKRIRGLWWPFVKWGLIFLALHNIFVALHIVEYPYNLRMTAGWVLKILPMNGAERLLGGYWFIVEAFFSSVIVFSLLLAIHRLRSGKPISGGGYRVNIQHINRYIHSFSLDLSPHTEDI